MVQDEVLAHRIGLVPLNVDPSYFEFKSDARDQATDRNTLVFKLDVTCTRKPKPVAVRGTKKAEPESEEIYNHSIVTSGVLTWEPQGEQSELLASKPPRPTKILCSLSYDRDRRFPWTCMRLRALGKSTQSGVPLVSVRYTSPWCVVHSRVSHRHVPPPSLSGI